MYLSWIIFDVAIVLNWVPYHLLTAVSGSGMTSFSIMTFVAIYVNVRLLKVSGLDKYFSKMVFLICCLLFLLGVGASAVLPVGSCYNSPFVMLMAISLLLFFVKFLILPPVVSKIVSWLSPLMFGVYVLHDTTTFGRMIYSVPQEWASVHLNWHPMLIVFVTAFICFVICTCVDCLRRIFMIPLLRPVKNKIVILDDRIGLPLGSYLLLNGNGIFHDRSS